MPYLAAFEANVWSHPTRDAWIEIDALATINETLLTRKYTLTTDKGTIDRQEVYIIANIMLAYIQFTPSENIAPWDITFLTFTAPVNIFGGRTIATFWGTVATSLVDVTDKYFNFSSSFEKGTKYYCYFVCRVI